MSEDSGEKIPDTVEEQVKTPTINTIEDEVDIDVLQNIPVTLSAEVGRTVMKIRDILQLSEGSIVELDRIAGESIDVLVNNTAVARAEVVVVNERYGIRLTQVLDAADRLRKL
ncbi:MAG: flagellar motor switch protein FliN [Methylococcales bacterium]|jgi:flagellar motor switch protein FliN/FliY|nr:flagellar motor switch protein FliN [Methylococcales bacterium]MDG2365027.1 flagellar motor switch protein FliN [Methylococcaceae bacterium]MBT3506389.1 flagellar motor switch protein FliN [Methylococcales bacterium]MBT3698709.1 flagellar motor switch protein FliN [Methylococcales bacterium]MBT3815808.1 flagellar motor switch protein FliN [Methylococcales bacterium]